MNNIAIIGAGVMGHGISQLFAQAGKNVRLYDVKESSLDNAKVLVSNSAKLMFENGVITEKEFDSAITHILYTTDLQKALQDAEFIVEVVPEILELKLKTYEVIESMVSKNSVIASNTSAITLKELTQNAKHPERFLITHFFAPAQLVPLVEIIKTENTDEQLIQITVDLMKQIGKTPIVPKKEVPGFIANRIQNAILREAFWLIENEVATAGDIDVVMKNSLGFRYLFLGPMEGQDLAGLNTCYFVCSNLFPVISDAKQPPKFLKKMIDDNNLGIRTGKGFFTYEGNEGEEKIRTRDNNFMSVLKLKKEVN